MNFAKKNVFYVIIFVTRAALMGISGAHIGPESIGRSIRSAGSIAVATAWHHKSFARYAYLIQISMNKILIKITTISGAPWVSHAANKRIVHAAKGLIEVEKIESLLSAVL